MRDYSLLVGFELPELRQSFPAREAILYALSVGVGQDPTAEPELDFVDHRRTLRVLPSAGFVLGHPGVWVSHPGVDLDLSKVLNAEQFISLRRSLRPREDVRSRMRIVEVVDKGPGRAVLIHTEREVLDAADGTHILTVHGTTYVRGEGGFGGARESTRALAGVPDRPPDVVEDMRTRPEQALLYRLLGDDNPMHSDPALARKAGFERPILHGLCTMGFACHAVVKHLCGYRPERLAAFGGRFSAPVFPGEAIRVEMWSDGAFRVRQPERGVVVIDNGIARLAAGGR